MKFVKAFRGARRGEVFPTDFKAGDECPPELLDAAKAAGAVEEQKPAPKSKAAG
ncbi:hypothetical protein [Mesorhizobium sp. SP-1A]|uniref:hypothetical protein n=1 Tax=Mesorhizobium sp. SP-1A TaxID=3077840 RepID=UPI0028F71900|nr:hypothetical protein [Mesorhizobium sp. SP-1A]